MKHPASRAVDAGGPVSAEVPPALEGARTSGSGYASEDQLVGIGHQRNSVRLRVRAVLLRVFVDDLLLSLAQRLSPVGGQNVGWPVCVLHAKELG